MEWIVQFPPPPREFHKTLLTQSKIRALTFHTSSFTPCLVLPRLRSLPDQEVESSVSILNTRCPSTPSKTLDPSGSTRCHSPLTFPVLPTSDLCPSGQSLDTSVGSRTGGCRPTRLPVLYSHVHTHLLGDVSDPLPTQLTRPQFPL